MTSDPVARYLAVRAAKVERRARLRPMASGEIIDSSLGAARVMGGQFLRVSLIPTLFCLAALDFIFGFALPQLQYTQRPDSTLSQIGEAIFAVSLAIFVGGPIFLIGATYAGSVVMQVTSDFIVGKSSDLSTAEASVRDRLGLLFLCGLRELAVCFGCVLAGGVTLMSSGLLADVTSADNPIAGMLAVIGGFALAGGGIAALVLLSQRAIMFPLVVIERVGLRDASRRMRELTKAAKHQPSGAGTVGSLYGISVLVFGAIYLGIATIIELFDLESVVKGWAHHSMIQPLLTTALWLIPAFCAIWALLPFWAVVLTYVYYERRIRIEGFDIEQLAEEIGRDGRTNRFNV